MIRTHVVKVILIIFTDDILPQLHVMPEQFHRPDNAVRISTLLIASRSPLRISGGPSYWFDCTSIYTSWWSRWALARIRLPAFLHITCPSNDPFEKCCPHAYYIYYCSSSLNVFLIARIFWGMLILYYVVREEANGLYLRHESKLS